MNQIEVIVNEVFEWLDEELAGDQAYADDDGRLYPGMSLALAFNTGLCGITMSDRLAQVKKKLLERLLISEYPEPPPRLL